jgi:predicted ATPase
VRELPSGTVTFLFTDIEGSTRLLHELGDAYADVLAEHRRVLREAFARHGGVEVDTQGDAFFVAFARASDALAAAREAQAALNGPIRVRMGLHTGEPLVTEDGYVGIDIHRAARIAASGHGRQVLVSQSTRDLVGADSLRDLGEHRLKDLTAPERIYQLGDGDFPPLKSLHQTNLPVQPMPLVGRERDLAELLELVEAHRLVTLTGPGGIGKTRLALQVASEVLERHPDGVWFVPLASVRDPELVEPTIAQVIGATGSVIDRVNTERVLLLLDNFEQIEVAGPYVARLVEGAPGLRVIVTSRVPLHVRSEQEYPVPSLSDAEAVELFVARARAVKPAFRLDEHVKEICRRLDGLPLAVELAAPRVKALQPEQILRRLERRLPLLTGGARDAPERQRTLRSTIEWSYELLAEAEKSLVARLAVFAGSFELDAAEAVCDADLDTISSLVDKSLLRQTDAGRFFMLETIHEYAFDVFEHLPDADVVRERHARYFFELCVATQPLLGGIDQDVAVARLAAHYGDIRLALAWIAKESPELELRFALALGKFWQLRLYLDEGRAWLAEALEHAIDAPVAERAEAAYRLADIAYDEGLYADAKARFEESLELSRRGGEPKHVATCLNGLALVAQYEDRLEDARALFDAAIASAGEAGAELYAAAFTQNLALLELGEGNDDRATASFRKVLVHFRNAGEDAGAGMALENLGFVALRRGDLDGASSLFVEALELSGRADWRLGLFCLAGMAGVASGQQRHLHAARLLGAVGSLCDQTHLTLERQEAEVEARARRIVRDALGDAAFTTTAWNEGTKMQLEHAIDYALANID